MLDPPSDREEFRGFDQARTIMWCHEARARVHERLSLTPFLADRAVRAVHVDDTARADRVSLTAFDAAGAQRDADTLFVDDAIQRVDVTPEFDHHFNGMVVPSGSELEQIILRQTGWVIDMAALRDYDLHADRVATQRAVFLAHLGDMLSSGQVHGFMLGQGNEESESGDPGAD